MDPHREPDHSTVDDGFGQSVQRDAELADRLTDDLGPDDADQVFDEEAEGRTEQADRHDRR